MRAALGCFYLLSFSVKSVSSADLRHLSIFGQAARY